VYGAADFFGGLASRRTSTFGVVVWSQAAGFLVLVVALPALPGTWRGSDLAWGALCGIVGAAAVGLLYRGLAIGSMGVISPITAVLAALLPALYGILHHAQPTRLASVGIVLALIAVVAISAAPAAPNEQRGRGIPEACVAGILFGTFFIVLAQTHADAGLFPLVGARTASFVVYGLAGLLLRLSFRPTRNSIGIIIVGGMCDMLANVLYILAVHSGGMITIVAVLSALYPASTVALAAIFLRERLRRLQWLGVGLALAGVACISAGK
jgi:drug/metabolite transporter (DMT)-like permease